MANRKSGDNMGYFYLILALFGGLLKGFSAKKLSNDVYGFKDCLIANFFRMLFCAIIGFFCLGFDTVILNISLKEFYIFILSSVSMVAFCVTYMFAYKVSAYMYLSIFGMLGSVLTCFLDLIIYKERITFNKWLGIGIVFIAVIIMSKYNKDIKGVSIKGILILIAAALSVGISDFSQKIYVREINGQARTFNFYTYLLSTILITVILLLFKNKTETLDVIRSYGLRNIILCLFISGGLFINSLSKTTVANYMSSAEIYPVLQGANLIASSILAQILLKEKINKKSMLGMLCAFIGLLVMHI